MLRARLLVRVLIGLALVFGLSAPSSAIYQYCSSTYCSGSTTRQCTCPGVTPYHFVSCGSWASGGCNNIILP